MQTQLKIDFEDAVTGSEWAYIPSGYQGLTWSDCGVYRGDDYPGTGSEYGVVSGNWVAEPAEAEATCEISSTTPFSVGGFHATGFSYTGLIVLAESFDLGDVKRAEFSATLGDPRNGAQFIDLSGGDFDGVYMLKISASGGTSAGLDTNYEYPYVVVDDLLILIH